MGIVNKIWKCKLTDGTDIEVQNYVKVLSFMTGEIVRINGVEVIHTKRNLLSDSLRTFKHMDSRYKFQHNFNTNSGQDANLQVVIHYNFLLLIRCHIKIDGTLIGGDTNKTIFNTPGFIDALLIFFITFFSFLIPSMINDIYNYNAKIKKIVTSVREDSPELWNYEVSALIKDEDHEVLLEKKRKYWYQQCNTNSDFHCRLYSYVEDDDSKWIKLTSKACSKGYIPSCYSVYLSKNVPQVSPIFILADNMLKTFCTTNKKMTRREKLTCSNYSLLFYKTTGDIKTTKAILQPLCDEDVKKVCDKIKWLNSIEDSK